MEADVDSDRYVEVDCDVEDTEVSSVVVDERLVCSGQTHSAPSCGQDLSCTTWQLDGHVQPLRMQELGVQVPEKLAWPPAAPAWVVGAVWPPAPPCASLVLGFIVVSVVPAPPPEDIVVVLVAVLVPDTVNVNCMVGCALTV